MRIWIRHIVGFFLEYFIVQIRVPDPDPLGSVTFVLPDLDPSCFLEDCVTKLIIESLTLLYCLPFVTSRIYLPL